MRLKFELKFDGYLLFSGFLPETLEQGIRFELKGGKYSGTLYMPNRAKQLKNVSLVPNNDEELKQWAALLCGGLTLELEMSELSAELVEAIEARKINENTEKFGRELFEVVAGIHTRVVDYFRNINKQSWIQPMHPLLGGYPEDIKYSDDFSSPQVFMNGWDAKWLDDRGEWRSLTVGRQINRGTATLSEGIDKETWERLADTIERSKGALMRDILLANSLQHIEEKNERLAVIESVIALESSIKHLLPRVIVRLPGAPQIDEGALEKLFKKAGLSSVTEVIFRLIQNSVGLTEDEINLVTEAIATRNEIVHGSRRHLDASKARKYVHVIRRICESFASLAKQREA